MALSTAFSDDILKDYLDSFYSSNTESLEPEICDDHTAEDDLLDLYLDEDASSIYDFESKTYVDSGFQEAEVRSCIESLNLQSDFFGQDSPGQRFVEVVKVRPGSQPPLVMSQLVSVAIQHPEKSGDVSTEDTVLKSTDVEL